MLQADGMWSIPWNNPLRSWLCMGWASSAVSPIHSFRPCSQNELSQKNQKSNTQSLNTISSQHNYCSPVWIRLLFSTISIPSQIHWLNPGIAPAYPLPRCWGQVQAQTDGHLWVVCIGNSEASCNAILLHVNHLGFLCSRVLSSAYISSVVLLSVFVLIRGSSVLKIFLFLLNNRTYSSLLIHFLFSVFS